MLRMVCPTWTKNASANAGFAVRTGASLTRKLHVLKSLRVAGRVLLQSSKKMQGEPGTGFVAASDPHKEPALRAPHTAARSPGQKPTRAEDIVTLNLGS